MNQILLLFMFLLSCAVFGSSDGFFTQTTYLSQNNKIQEKNNAPSPAPWIKFTPKSGGFTILFPGQPTESVDNFQQESLIVPTHMYDLEVSKIKYFVLRLGDVPENTYSSIFLDNFFNNAYKIFFEYTTKDGKREMSKITNQQEFSLNSIAIRHYESDCGPYKTPNPEPCGVTLRVYKSARSIYVVGLTAPKSIMTADRVNEFLDSFSITQ